MLCVDVIVSLEEAITLKGKNIRNPTPRPSSRCLHGVMTPTLLNLE